MSSTSSPPRSKAKRVTECDMAATSRICPFYPRLRNFIFAQPPGHNVSGLGRPLLRKPIPGIAGCCARALSGHAAAAPPSSVMNSRRPMSSTGLRPPLWARGASNDHPPGRRPMQSVCSMLRLPRRVGAILGADLNCSESRVQCRYFRIRACHSPTGFSPSSTRCGVWQFSIHARAPWPVNVNALTHWQADHAILFYC